MLEELLVAGFAGLVVTPLAVWIQRGGRQARLRKRISDELDLIQKLADFPEAQERLRSEVRLLLEQYEPRARAELDKRAPLSGWLAGRRGFWILFVLPVVVGMVTVVIWPKAPTLMPVFVMTSLSLGLNLTALILETRQQDRYVKARNREIHERLDAREGEA